MTGETVDLVLVPAEDPGAGVTYPDLASSPVDGCWRFVDTEGNTPTRAPVSTHLAATLAPGETYAIRHEVYHDGDSETCFPGDPYRTSAAVVFVAPGGRSEPFAFTYTLSVGGDGEPTVAVDGPERLTDEE